MALLIASLLLLAIPFDRFRMSFAVLLPVFPVRRAPLFLAGTYVGGISRITADSLPVIVAASLPLASRLAANALFRSVDRWLENLLAVATTPARPHARFLLSSGVRSRKLPRKTKSDRPAEYRNFYRILTASLRVGLRRQSDWLRRIGDIGSLSHRP